MSDIKMHLVPMDVDLDLHDRMITMMGASMSKTKKRLVETELTLNLRPGDGETAELAQWDIKVNALLSKRDELPFPALHQVKQEHAEIALGLTTTKRLNSAEWDKKQNEILLRQIEHLQARVLNRGDLHTNILPGDEIRTIKNYTGSNFCNEDGSRTLIRKESKGWEDTTSSLPPWFGPLYYHPNVTNYDVNKKSDNSYKVAFKATSRNIVSSERAKRANMNRRKEEIKNVQLKQNEYKTTMHKNSNYSIAYSDFKDFQNSQSIVDTVDNIGECELSPSKQQLSNYNDNKNNNHSSNNNRKAPALFATDVDDDGYSYGESAFNDSHSIVSNNIDNISVHHNDSSNNAINSTGKRNDDSIAKRRDKQLMSINTTSVSYSGSINSNNLNQLSLSSSASSLLQPTLHISQHSPVKREKSNKQIHSMLKSMPLLGQLDTSLSHHSILSIETSPNQRTTSRATTSKSQSSTKHSHSNILSPNRTSMSKTPTNKTPKSSQPSPLYAANPFAVKLLGLDTVSTNKVERFKVKDYTRNAFITTQATVSREMCYDYEENDNDITNANNVNNANNSHNGMNSMSNKHGDSNNNSAIQSRANSRPQSSTKPLQQNDSDKDSTLNIKFSSRIFKVPNVDYAPAFKSSDKNTTSSTVYDKVAISRPVSPVPIAIDEAYNNAVAQPMIFYPTANKASGVLVTDNEINDKSANVPTVNNITIDTSPAISDTKSVIIDDQQSPLPPVRRSRVPFNKAQLQKIGQKQKRHTSTDLFISKILNKPIDDVTSHSTINLNNNGDHNNDTTNNGQSLSQLHPIQLQGNDFNLTSSISQWYKQNDVIAPTNELTKSLRKKDTFLSKHHELPSIETSLNGLLLDENPYYNKNKNEINNYIHDVEVIQHRELLVRQQSDLNSLKSSVGHCDLNENGEEECEFDVSIDDYGYSDDENSMKNENNSKK